MADRCVTVLGRANSLNVRKVMWCAAELGVPVARKDFGRGAEPTNTPAFLALNPNGMVPVLTHGDAVMWESNTILRYLCAVFGTPAHLPCEPAARAACEKWMDWQLGTLQVAMATLFHGKIVSPGSATPGALERAEGETNALMRRLDDALVDAFLNGGAPGAADFAIGPNVHRFYKVVSRPVPLSRVAAYYARLSDRPAFAAHVGLDAP